MIYCPCTIGISCFCSCCFCVMFKPFLVVFSTGVLGVMQVSSPTHYHTLQTNHVFHQSFFHPYYHTPGLYPIGQPLAGLPGPFTVQLATAPAIRARLKQHKGHFFAGMGHNVAMRFTRPCKFCTFTFVQYAQCSQKEHPPRKRTASPLPVRMELSRSTVKIVPGRN